MNLDIYKKIMSDKGSSKKGTVNVPLAEYLVEEDYEPEFLSTNVITLNLLFSGRVHGGIAKGKISMMSAPSMLGKSFVAMSIVKSAQKKGMNVVVIDTERAFSFKTAKALGIDTSKEKLVVLQDNSLEQVETIILKIVNDIPKKDRKNILFVIDSWGTLVTSKTIEDGLAGKDVKNMTESQKKNRLANVILNTQATFFVINHVYDNTGGFGDPMKIPGGRRIMFNSDAVVLGTSRAKHKEKDGAKDVVVGHIISAQTFKSRYSIEKSVLQFRIKHNGGLDVFFGLKEEAIKGNYIKNSKPGWFVRSHIKDDKPVKEDKMYTMDFWYDIFKNTDFKEFLEKRYCFSNEFDIVEHDDKIEEITKKGE